MPVERIMRDYRINKIFEGSTEIMHLFMAREMVDRHLQVAGALIDPDKPLAAKLAVLPKMAAFYAWWYPTRFLGWGFWPRYAGFGPLATHLRFVERTSRRLARASFHGMLVYQAKLQNKQAFLFRLVDIANETFAMAASVSRAQTLADTRAPEATRGRAPRRRLLPAGAAPRARASSGTCGATTTPSATGTASRVLKGDEAWLEAGILPHEARRPASVDQKQEVAVEA